MYSLTLGTKSAIYLAHILLVVVLARLSWVVFCPELGWPMCPQSPDHLFLRTSKMLAGTMRVPGPCFLPDGRLAQVCLHVRGRDLRQWRGPGPQQAWAQSWWALASFILLLRVSHRSARLKGRGDKLHLLLGGASDSHAEVWVYRKGNNWPFLQTVHYDSVCFRNSAWLISLFVCLFGKLLTFEFLQAQIPPLPIGAE